MECGNCGREVSPAANFCQHCGVALNNKPGNAQSDAALPPGLSPDADADPAALLNGLRAVAVALQGEVARLSRRVDALERGQSRPAAATPAPATPAAATPFTAPATPYPGGGQGGAAASLPDRLRAMDWEWLLGGNWLARVGILAVVIGVGFFLKLAFDNDWIGETGRVVLGLVIGIGLLGGGEYWRRKYAVWAQALTGGGIAILYLSVFAAFALYELIPPLPALGFSVLVTLTAAGLALRYEARAIAVLGILGGFAAPLMLVEQLPAQAILLAYVLALDLGVLGLATFRNWRWLTLLGLAGSLILFGYWQMELEPGLLLSQVALTILFLIFVGATTLFHLLWRRQPGVVDQALMTLNAAAYFGISYLLLFAELRLWMGGFTLLLAAFYGALGYAIIQRHQEQIRLSLFAVGIALVLLTIAVPVQLGGAWVSVAWAAEAAALVWLSFLLGMRPLRWFGMALFGLLAGQLLIFHGVPLDSLETYRFLLNWRMLAFGGGIAAMYLAAYILWRERDGGYPAAELFFQPVLLIAANFLSLYALSVEVFDAFYFGYFAIPDSIAGNVTSLALSILWAGYAAVLITLGIARRSRWLRLAGLGLLAIPVVKLFAYDAFDLEREYRVAAFIGLGAMLLAGGFLYQRYRRLIRGFLLDD